MLVNLNVDRYRKPPAVPTDLAEGADAGDAERRVDDRDEVRRMLASLALRATW